MNEDCVGIGRAQCLCQIQCMTYRAAVVCTMIDKVKEDLEPSHSPSLTIDKFKR
jgi:hypothetical protein